MSEEIPATPPQQPEPSAAEIPSPIATPTPSPWTMPKEQALFLLLMVFTVSVSLFLRLFELDTLQNEIYGDIDIVMAFMKEIFLNQWPVNFILSAGPLYHYLIAPIVLLTGQNYGGMKIASVIVSLAGLAGMYAFSRRLINDHFALLALFITGVSSWLMIFSRLGNSQIALPLLTVLSLWSVVRIIQFGKQSDVILCAFISSLGFFIYPQSFIQPGIIFATLLCLAWVKQPLPKRWALYYILACIPAAIFFAYLIFADPGNFNGYIGNKIQAEGSKAVGVLFENIGKTLLALHIRGDEGYRSNPSTLPHLDWMSGIFFIVGIIFWTTSKEKRRWIPLWLVPLILLQIPSILVLSHPNEVPSASRTLGAAPIAYLLVASGLWWLAQFLFKRTKNWLAISVMGLLLTSIFVLNVQRYFQNYISGLPYNNTPIGHILATYINMLPADTHVYVFGCCWADGVPDNFYHYEVNYPENLHYSEPTSLSCSQLQNIPHPAILVWGFEEIPTSQLKACKDWLTPQLYTYKNMPIFNASLLRPGELDEATLEKIQLDALVHGAVQFNGETILVDYSPIDMGQIDDLFDGKANTLMRGNGANPIFVGIHFSPPRKLSTLDLTLGSMVHFQVALTIGYTDNTTKTIEQDYENLPDDPKVTIQLPDSDQDVLSIQVAVKDFNAPTNDTAHIHLRELEVH